jgi:predicted flavoprotein YhiN
VEVVISGKQIQSINVTGAGRVQAAEVRLLAGGSFNITGSSRVSYNLVEAEDMAILETGASQLEINSIASKSVDLRVEGSSQLEIKTGSIN